MASALETLCGQAYGAKNYKMLGVYLQRSWIVLFVCCLLSLPLYIFASPVLKLLGQPADIAELSGVVAISLIPLHFSLCFQFPIQRFLQSQLKTYVIAWVSMMALVVHLATSWLIVYRYQLGLVGTVVTLNISWWLIVIGLFSYTVCGGCPESWSGFSMEAFQGLWGFVKLSAASGVMLWYSILLHFLNRSILEFPVAGVNFFEAYKNTPENYKMKAYIFLKALYFFFEQAKFINTKSALFDSIKYAKKALWNFPNMTDNNQIKELGDG